MREWGLVLGVTVGLERCKMDGCKRVTYNNITGVRVCNWGLEARFKLGVRKVRHGSSICTVHTLVQASMGLLVSCTYSSVKTLHQNKRFNWTKQSYSSPSKCKPNNCHSIFNKIMEILCALFWNFDKLKMHNISS